MRNARLSKLLNYFDGLAVVRSEHVEGYGQMLTIDRVPVSELHLVEEWEGEVVSALTITDRLIAGEISPDKECFRVRNGVFRSDAWVPAKGIAQVAEGWDGGVFVFNEEDS